MTDPISDLLTRIRNATRAGHASVKCPRSKLKIEVLKDLTKRRVCERFFEEEPYKNQGML